MSKNLSAKFYQENKKRLQNQAHEKYQNLSKEEKSDNMAVNIRRIYQKMKNKNLLSIDKNIIEWEIKIIILRNNDYYIGYRDSEKIRPLWIFCSQMIIYKTILMKKDVFTFW